MEGSTQAKSLGKLPQQAKRARYCDHPWVGASLAALFSFSIAMVVGDATATQHQLLSDAPSLRMPELFLSLDRDALRCGGLVSFLVFVPGVWCNPSVWNGVIVVDATKATPKRREPVGCC